MHVIFDGVSTFNPHQRSQFVLAVCALDIGGGEGHHHAIGMMRRLFIDRVDQIEAVLCVIALVGLGIDPDGKEFRSQIAAPGFVETDVPDVVRVRRADVESLIEKALRGIGVRINDQGRVMNLTCFGADCGVWRLGNRE